MAKAGLNAMSGNSIKPWLIRFAALWLLLALAAGIPSSVMGMMYGSASYTLAAIILATLLHMWDPRQNLRQLIIVYLVLATVVGLFLSLVVSAG